MYGNRASRCATGFNLGYDRGPFPAGAAYVNVFANLSDRCLIGLDERPGAGARFSNLICANILNDVKTGLPVGPYSDGVLEPAAISSISVSARTATVTTTQPHNLHIGGTTLLELILNPPTLTPDGTGNQNVNVTVTGASQFAYPLGGSGTFSNPGTWNIPCLLGISGNAFARTAYFSNILTSRPVGGSFALYSFQFGTSNDATKDNFVCAMQGPYGWAGPNLGNDPNQVAASAFSYVMCGLPASASRTYGPPPNPLAYLKMAALTDPLSNIQEGKEVNIIDAQLQPSFAGVVTPGGSNHYKVRHDEDVLDDCCEE